MYVSVNSGKPFGYGIKSYNNGAVYKGEMANGLKNGYGTYSWSGGVYEGEWVNNQATGYGTKNEASSDGVFVGNFVRMRLNGIGKVIYNNGDVLDGLFNNGSIIIGTFSEPNNETPVKYGFLDGSNGSGVGVFTTINGTTIESRFSNGRIIGTRGIYAFNNGEHHSLRRKTNQQYSNRDKALFKKIKNAGFMDGQIDFTEKKGTYTSGGNIGLYNYIPKNIINDKIFSKVGFGIATLKNGAVYTGYFEANTINTFAGYGEVFFGPDDSRESYKGIWINGSRNGYGVLTYKNGKVEKGVFRKNKFFKEADFDLNLMQEILKDF